VAPRDRLSRDSLEYERRGRLLRDDHYRGVTWARARELLRLDVGASGAGVGGTARQSQAIGGGRSSETVLKVISWTKSRHAPMAQARYAARTREGDPPEKSLAMFNEEGRELRGPAVAAEIESWELKSDGENLSAAARRVTPQGRSAMPKKERLDKRQAAHLIFSIPAKAAEDAHALRRAVHGALSESFGAAGHRYVYTIHTDHSVRPHAHIVVKAESEPMRGESRRLRTTQLRIGPRELEGLRQVFTRHAQEQGLNVVATRREDRAQLRSEIVAGRAPLRTNRTMQQAQRTSRQGRTFERQAPQWYAEHGMAYERRRLELAGQTRAEEGEAVRSVPETGSVPSRPGLLARLFGRRVAEERPVVQKSEESKSYPGADRRSGGYFENFGNYRKGRGRTAEAVIGGKIAAHFQVTHRDPERAAESFWAMFRETPRLAVWAANRHPWAFGDPTGQDGPGFGLTDVLKRNDSRVSAVRRELGPTDPHGREHLAIRDAVIAARARVAADKTRSGLVRSFNHLAVRIEREMGNDVEGAKAARQVRHIADGLDKFDAEIHKAAPEELVRLRDADAGNVATQHNRKLEAEIMRRDKARGRNQSQDRSGDERDR